MKLSPEDRTLIWFMLIMIFVLFFMATIVY